MKGTVVKNKQAKPKRVKKPINFKMLISCIGQYKKATILAPLFIVLEVVMECLLPYVMSLLINDISNVTEPITMSKIGIYALILVGMASLSLLFGTLSGIQASKASSGFAQNLRHKLFNSVQSFSFENIDKFSVPSLVSRLTTDVVNIQNSFMMIIRIAVRAPLMFVFSLVMAFILNVQIALIFVAVVPVMLGIMLALWFSVSNTYDRIFRKYDDVNESVQENIAGMRVVKSFVREDYESEKFHKVSDELKKDFTFAERVMGLMNPGCMLCMYVTMVLISFFSASMIVKSGGTVMNTGDLSGLITYAVQVLSSLIMATVVFAMIAMSRASAERITEVLVEKPTIISNENADTVIENGDIDFDDVSFKYSARAERYALEDINLHIKSGQTVGIIGGTGSSKSSLVQLIPRLYDVTEGTLKVGGKDVRSYDVKALRDSVAVVLQKNILFSGTIKENLRWGNENATDEQIVHACKLAQAHEFISALPNGYDTHIEQGGSNVSGGQKQRLCIARAILKNPKILILDDSTSAVDTKTDALIRRAFIEEIPNTTKLIVAQRITSVQDSDMIIVMENGKIQGCGTHDELIKSNVIYQEVYRSQNKEADDE